MSIEVALVFFEPRSDDRVAALALALFDGLSVLQNGLADRVRVIIGVAVFEIRVEEEAEFLIADRADWENAVAGLSHVEIGEGVENVFVIYVIVVPSEDGHEAFAVDGSGLQLNPCSVCKCGNDIGDGYECIAHGAWRNYAGPVADESGAHTVDVVRPFCEGKGAALFGADH